MVPLTIIVFFLHRREREAATIKRGPKKKVDQQQQSSSSGRLQRDRRLSTSSSSEGDSDDGESGSSGSSSGSSASEDETEKETAPPPPPVTANKETEKKVIEKPLSSPPSCRAAATAAGPKIASAFRADRSITVQSSSNDPKSTNKQSDLTTKEKKKDKDKEKEKEKEKDKDLAGTKRKAEVLSDNGRVGVTISTTSLDRSRSPRSPSGINGSGPLSPTAKMPRLAPVTTPTRTSAPVDVTTVPGNPNTITKEPHVTLSISLSPNGEAVARPGLDWRDRSNQQQQHPPSSPAHQQQQQQQPQQQRSLSQDEQSAKMALLSLQRGANKYSPSSPASRPASPTRPPPVLSPALPGESAHPPSSGLSKRAENTGGGSLSDQENVNLNGHGPNGRKQVIPASGSSDHHLLTPNLDYWHRKNPLVDQIFITDVTVNMMTVTIRECKTVSGFFRHHPGSSGGSADNSSSNDATTEADGK